MVRLTNTRLSLKSKVLDKEKNIDFFDTHSPVTRIISIWVIVPLVAVHNSIVFQMDVKVAFFYGELEEEIYMKQPESFAIHGQENKVCKLDNSL